MPIYDVECREASPCGVFVDEYLTLSEVKEGFLCPKCGGQARHVHGFSAPFERLGTHGPTETKPLIIESAGLRFTSQSQINEWQKANPRSRIVTKTDKSGFGDHYDQVRNRVERTARRQGFKSHRHRGETLKARQKG